uniref:Calponin-homology (CH) domain-containing protein n=1 Tax=Parascaris equorum TaxID=6256 RepID=A0A914S076_PAREQ
MKQIEIRWEFQRKVKLGSGTFEEVVRFSHKDKFTYSDGIFLRYAPEGVRDQKLAEAIKDWCLERTQNFEEVQINDFTSSWRDGYAINAILLSYNPELFDMDNVRQMRGDERIEHAMGIAERHLNVPRLLKPKGASLSQRAFGLKECCDISHDDLFVDKYANTTNS